MLIVFLHDFYVGSGKKLRSFLFIDLSIGYFIDGIPAVAYRCIVLSLIIVHKRYREK